MEQLDDKTLVSRCLAKDRQAWVQFVERFSPLVFWAIRQRLNYINCRYSRQDVEDIFQDVFSLLWQKDKLRQIKNRASISGWLAMVAANCAHNFFRDRIETHLKRELLPEEIAVSDCGLPEAIKQEDLKGILEKAFNFLSPHEIVILKLNYLYDKTNQDIAKILKMPVNTVFSIIKRTKEKLKDKLEKEGFKYF